MVQEVYVDLYFLVNLSMDLLCLMIAAALLHLKTGRLRALAAAVLGGAYAVVALLCGLTGAVGFLLDLAVAVLMCGVAFFHRGTRPVRILKCSVVYAIASMMLGGVMTALYAWLNRLQLPFEMLEGDGLSVWTFALLTAVASVVTLRGGRLFGLSQKTKKVTVSATLFGSPVTLTAMVDSGNLLRDPVSGKGVIVADLARLAPLLPPDVRRACESRDLSLFPTAYELAGRLRPIPTQTASGTSMLLAILPDSLRITRAGESYPADYLIAPAPLGETAQGFDAVIPLE